MKYLPDFVLYVIGIPFAVCAIVLMLIVNFAYADTADWTATCSQYIDQVVVTPIEQSCDLNGDGVINTEDFTLAYEGDATGQITLPAAPTVSFSSNAGIDETGGGQLLPGTIWCSQYASTCMRVNQNGSDTFYPNPSWNQ